MVLSLPFSFHLPNLPSYLRRYAISDCSARTLAEERANVDSNPQSEALHIRRSITVCFWCEALWLPSDTKGISAERYRQRD
jgi:hypothetical protein